ncbi:alpha-glucuronidase [Kineothrix sp. MB12-C1]|uniref:alpha-glucuronidase n=1 Tax=Kineothrix sp. MB12-C1 TaxID=3070215 RepID=UPI0027D20C71|nr:alpha-glucuronidase [Kineothrix sp. MB12-C1]WMC93318.1 alpha-glucuronidase [Kineothrix sp. MB12-C1]
MYTNCWLAYRQLYKSAGGGIPIFCSPKFYKQGRRQEGRIIDSAILEIEKGIMGLFGRKTILVEEEPEDREGICLVLIEDMEAEEYCITAKGGRGTVAAADGRGILYGVFAMLRNLQLAEGLREFEEWDYEEACAPDNPIRMLNHWDNLDGSIERGYSGESFFFKSNEVLTGERVEEYARLAASVGINAAVINNVNVKEAATELITHRYYEKVNRISDIFASYGIDLYLSINYASPIELGSLTTADPCDGKVIQWWKDKAAEIWEHIPLLGGFLVKADSEGRPGPFTYGRTHSDGANMLADALLPYGGRILWRCFVYNCTQDWRDTKTDRANAAYDHFKPLDGSFRDNVILQIKNGPMDFQVREPVSPLFGALSHTNIMLEVQAAQEYTGQQWHVCYLIPWFKEILEFDMCCISDSGRKKPCQNPESRVADLIRGGCRGGKNCGIAAVANTGNDENWTGHDLAAANFYGFGRLSFQTSLTAEQIAKEWIILTFGDNKKVMENLFTILLMSWQTYEKYTSPLGIGWMVNPEHHYGPNVDGYEYDRWGTYHRADSKGIGVDRSPAGTGFCNRYNEPLASMFADAKSCPEEVLLFFHHMPYSHQLKSGKTIIQHIYDTHFEGAQDAARFLELFEEIEPYLDKDAYDRIHARMLHQKEHSVEWRDRINTYFYRMSGIPDEKGRKIYGVMASFIK